MADSRTQAEALISAPLNLIKQILVKHAASMLEELEIQLRARSEKIRELEAKLAESSRDAERFAYLTADHDDAEVRERRNDLLCRMPVMSHSAACADIDIRLAALAAERKEGKRG